jgi:dipeptidyl-peptidase-4
MPHPCSPALPLLAVVMLTLPTPAADPAAATHETRDVLGWTLHVNRSLAAADAEATETAIKLLEKQLAEVVRVVPAAAVAELRQTPLWFSPEYPGVGPKAEFHPDPGWLRANGRDPAMARAIEFTNIRIFPQECDRMPNFALHELAHAFHFRVLGFDDPAVKDAFERARAAGLYDTVEQRHGGGRPATLGRAYAMSDPMEYFAESSEAYFSRNDFFPFTRDELAAHDPRMLRVLETAWGVASKTTRAN